MQLKPAYHVLEIGGGAGLLAELVAGKLDKGRFTGVDKSAPMVQKAIKRNKRYIDAGISEFIVSDFLKTELPSSHYDRVAAFNVNFFWKDPKRELEIIKRVLRPNGKLYVFYQAPFEITAGAAEPIKQKLLENAFEILDIQTKKLVPTSAFCIVAKPSL